MMKRVLASIFLMLPVMAFAGHGNVSECNKERLEEIYDANSRFNTIECDFTEVKTLKASGRKIEYSGKMTVTLPDGMRMIYDIPEGDIFIIEGKTLRMSRGKKTGTYNLEKNESMRNLAELLLNCMTGDIVSIADKYDAVVTSKDTGENVMVRLDSRKKATRGYDVIELLFNQDSLLLDSITLVEYSGNSTTYTMHDTVRK